MGMDFKRRLLLGCCLVLGLLSAGLGSAASALAFNLDPLGFRLSSPVYTVHENEGAAVVTIQRIDTTREAQIRYLTLPGSAVRGQDFRAVRSMIDFQPGQATASFRVPIYDHHMPGLPRTVNIGIFGPSPVGMTSPHNAVLTIINDDPLSLVRDMLNPLGLPTAPPASDPLRGASPYIDSNYGLAAVAARRWRRTHPRAAGMLDVIAREPEVHRFGNWVPRSEIGLKVSQYLEQAAIEQPGRVPEFATYWVVDSKRARPHCGSYSDPPWRVAAYHQWIHNLAAGVSGYPAIMFLEMDSLITVGCLSHHGLQVRLQELHDAIDTLAKVPHLVVYLDAGAADALDAAAEARLLRGAGVSEIQGFFLNSTHFDWTLREIRYGEKISRMTGGKHFVVNTAENGRGPLVPRDRVHNGNEILCNPPGRGLGPLPTFNTGYRNVDAFAWIANPGKSGGPCRPGAPSTGFFWPQLALELVRNADFRVR